MNTNDNGALSPLEGRTFIIGREGHIYISDPAVSKEHAEMRIIDGKIRIRDLGSTNGIYVLEGDKPVRLKEEYLEPHQMIAIGQETHSVRSLLDIVGTFSV